MNKPQGPFWDDLSEAQREAHRQRVDGELRAIGERSYPVEALWGPAGEAVEVLGPARRFPPYDDPAYGPQTYRGDFQLLSRRLDGQKVILMANHLRDPLTRLPWLTPSPGKRDPRGPLERMVDAQRRQNPSTHRKHPKAVTDALYRLMLDAFDCGPIDGGCVTTARGLCQALGGEMYTLEGSSRNGSTGAQHALCKVWDRFFDGEGTWTEKGILDHWRKLEGIEDGCLRPWMPRDLKGEAPDDPVVARKVAALFRKKNPDYGALENIQAFWADVLAEAPSSGDWKQGVDVMGYEDAVDLRLEGGEWEPVVWIEMVESKDRGHGKASRALDWLCSLADRHQVTLQLVPDAQEDEGLSDGALTAWYGRRGFQMLKDGVMRRLPRTPNPTLRLSGKMKEIPLDEDLQEDLASVLRIHSYPPTPGMLAFWKEYREGTKDLHGDDRGQSWAHTLHRDAVVLDLRMDPTQGTVHIIEVKSIEKRTGAGNRAIEFLTRLADKHQVTLTLVAQALGTDGMKQGDLVRWYRRHGFQRHGSRGWDMRRKPR